MDTKVSRSEIRLLYDKLYHIDDDGDLEITVDQPFNYHDHLYSGESEGSVIVVLEDTISVNSPTYNFLSKVLEAIKIEISSLPLYIQIDVSDKNQLFWLGQHKSKVLYFGQSPISEIVLYGMQSNGQNALYNFPSLTQLMEDMEAKRKLWTALKNAFPNSNK